MQFRLVTWLWTFLLLSTPSGAKTEAFVSSLPNSLSAPISWAQTEDAGWCSGPSCQHWRPFQGLYHYQITKLRWPSLFISRDPFSFVRVAKELPADIRCRDEASFSSPQLLARLCWLDAQETPSCKGAERAQAIGARIFIDADPWAPLWNRVICTKQVMGSLVLQNCPPLCKVRKDLWSWFYVHLH